MSVSSSLRTGAGGESLGGLLRLASRSCPNTRLISSAYEVAAYWHHGQKRKSGDPYITHPLAVATILARIGADGPTLCAALLHDVVEDTACTLAALEGRFGAEIAGLVDGVIALDALPAEQVAAASTDDAAAVALGGDHRVLLIKLADRLHNLRTVRHLPRAKQVLKSRQTLEIIVPLARTLRMEAISSELEDLASAVLYRHGYRPRRASDRLLAASTMLLPAAARARWREEWLAEIGTLPTRHERLTFAVQIMLGIGRLAITLYQPGSALKRIGGAILAGVVTAGTIATGGWRSTAVLAVTALAVLAAAMWVLHSEDRTTRLARLIHALRGAPRSESRDRGPAHHD
jgi:hypothetical protein